MTKSPYKYFKVAERLFLRVKNNDTFVGIYVARYKKINYSTYIEGELLQQSGHLVLSNDCYKAKKGLKLAKIRRDEIIQEVDSESGKIKNTKKKDRETFEQLFNNTLQDDARRIKLKNMSESQQRSRIRSINIMAPFFRGRYKHTYNFTVRTWEDFIIWHDGIEGRYDKSLDKIKEAMVYMLKKSKDFSFDSFEGKDLKYRTTKSPFKDKIVLTDEQINKLLKACGEIEIDVTVKPYEITYIKNDNIVYCKNRGSTYKQKFPENSRLKLQILIGLFMGVRNGRETFNMKFSDIITKNKIKYYRIRSDVDKNGRKRGRGRDVPMPDLIYKEIIAYKKTCAVKDSYLFPCIDNKTKKEDWNRPQKTNQRALKARGRSASIPYITPYCLRHTHITKAILSRKLGLMEMLEYLGTSYSMLKKTYWHILSETDQAVVDLFKDKEWMKGTEKN